MNKNKRNKQVVTAFILASITGVFIVGNALAADAKTAVSGGAETKTSESPRSANDWPQWRGPNRDGIVPNSPKLLDRWPKDGPPLRWKSDFIPAWRDGGCGAVVVADGKVFVYANKQPVDGGQGFKYITAEVLADWGWIPDCPEDLAKKLEEAWASPNRPSCGDWKWISYERSKKAELDAFLAKKPELDKYTKDFIATLKPEDAKKYGGQITIRLCTRKTESGKYGADFGFSWVELTKLSKLQDVRLGSCGDWAQELNKISRRHNLWHHFQITPILAALEQRSFIWSDAIYCLDAATGKQLWKKSFPVDKAVLKSPIFGGHAVQWWVFEGLGVSATPAVWNGKCYFAGSMGLYCVSAKDGSLLWQVKSGPEHASPLVADGIVYHCGVAYDAETGSVKWKNPLWVLGDGKHLRDEGEGRWSSPVLWTSGGKKYVLTTDGHNKNDLSAVCLELETGKVAWTVKCYTGFNTVGLIQNNILVEGMQENGAKSYGFKITPTSAELLWKGRFNLNGMTGSLIYRDCVYGNHGILFCASLKTGETYWKAGGAVNPEVAADGKIFGSADLSGSSETATVGMFRASPDKYEVLGSFNPEAVNYCHVALANGKLYVRTKDRIACYDIQEHGPYLDGVTATNETLTFRFKQTGGGLTGGLANLLLTAAGGTPAPAKAKINGDHIVVDVKAAPVPFRLACPANALTGKDGKPVPAFGWNEARLLKYRKAVEQNLLLKSDIPLRQLGAWDKPETYTVTGAKVTKVVLDPRGKGVTLITDKSWKPGDAVTLTYPCFAVAQGEARRETLTAKVVEVQRAAAKFVKSDTTTSGDWKGKYGAEGAMVAGDKGTTQAPKCANVEMRQCGVGTGWAQSDKDPTHLQLTGDKHGRSIQEWMAGDQLFIDIEFTDGKEHQAAMYVGCNRAMSVEVLDADTKEVLDTQNTPEGGKFRYMVWNLKGEVTLHVVNLGSAEASPIRVGGVFIDPAAQASQRAK